MVEDHQGGEETTSWSCSVSYLENHPSGIQEKIDTAIGHEIIDNEEGLEKLINYLDGIYGEDDMTEAFNSYQNFIRLKKTSNQTIAEFIAVFEGA